MAPQIASLLSLASSSLRTCRPPSWRTSPAAGFLLSLSLCYPARPREVVGPCSIRDSLPSHGAELFPRHWLLLRQESRAPYARGPCISLLAPSPQHAGAGPPWRSLPGSSPPCRILPWWLWRALFSKHSTCSNLLWSELEQPVFFLNAGTHVKLWSTSSVGR
jgi:hypothetical protein